jgi:hypothetical protein
VAAGSLQHQVIVIDLKRADLAVINWRIKRTAIGKLDLSPDFAISFRGSEIHVERITWLDTLGDPVIAPFPIFLSPKFESSGIRLIDHLEFLATSESRASHEN